MGELLQREVFRPVVTLIVPGVIAASPYIILVLADYGAARTFLVDNPAAFLAIALLLVIAVGLVLEDIGSRIEVRWDKRLDRDAKLDHTKTWDSYLALEIGDEVVGQRYLHTVVLRMKFELGTIPAIVVSWLGFLWLDLRHDVFGSTSFWFATALAAALFGFLIRESYASARVASRTRKILVGR